MRKTFQLKNTPKENAKAKKSTDYDRYGSVFLHDFSQLEDRLYIQPPKTKERKNLRKVKRGKGSKTSPWKMTCKAGPERANHDRSGERSPVKLVCTTGPGREGHNGNVRSSLTTKCRTGKKGKNHVWKTHLEKHD